MATSSWFDSSLRRSASLGLEVLERASRRNVDWSSSSSTQTPTTTEEEDAQTPVNKTHPELDEAFAAIADFMAQTTYQCRKFYQSTCCSELNDVEKNHVSRFHSRPASQRTTRTKTCTTPTRKHLQRVTWSHSRGMKETQVADSWSKPSTPQENLTSQESEPDEDFFIEVSPGTYAVTASTAESQRHTQLVSVQPGESVMLTFNL